MQGLNVFEKGIGYLEACLSYYTGSNAYAMLYVLALLYLLVFGNSREKQILNLRFIGGKTQMEVANLVGISQAQVSRLEKSALSSMRKSIS